MDKASRFVVVSSYFPPVIGGTSTVMRNLLAAFDPKTFSVISETPGSFDGQHNSRVPDGVSIVRTGVSPLITHKIPYGARIGRWCRFGLVPKIERMIVREVRRLDAKRIIAIYPSWPFLIAAYRAATKLRLPLFTYYMDVSAEVTELKWPDRPAVQMYEERILRVASKRLVLSEAIAEDYRRRWNLDSEVIPHSIDLAALPSAVARSANSGGVRKLVHTGVVEHLQSEGLQRIAKVLQDHPDLNTKLILSTPTSKEDLLARGFNLPCVEIVTLPQNEVYALQNQADVLVAVLPFHGRVTAYQKTAFPTKAVEYMAAGRPILAHAPGDSFFASHVRAHEYAKLVETTDEQELYKAIAGLLADVRQQERLAQNAHETVTKVFEVNRVARKFAEACGLAVDCLRC